MVLLVCRHHQESHKRLISQFGTPDYAREDYVTPNIMRAKLSLLGSSKVITKIGKFPFAKLRSCNDN
jgi:hypothetical protein